jgi:hypothetical protein
VFKQYADYEANEEKYQAVKKEIIDYKKMSLTKLRTIVLEKGLSGIYGALATGFDIGLNKIKVRENKTYKKTKRSRRHKKTRRH